LPVGVPGEICVGGGGVCRGYLNRDELTAKKFVVNPYKPDETIYRSGDLGRLLPSGEMVYMGRSDDQVQIRGFRVEPGEVQSQLLTHPLVTRAEVIAKTMHHGAVELVAYVVASGQLDVTELRTHVANALPHYMVPSAFVFIDEFPLTPNGKVDRRALPEPDQLRPDLGAAFVAPSTPTEETLASMWAEVLGLARVGVHDSFFELGGHSLLATQVTSRIRTAFNLEIPLRNLFERPTIAELAQEIDALTAAVTTQDSAPVMVRVARDEPLPLSFAQQRLWFLNQLEPNSAAYNMHTSLRISGPLNATAFEQTVSEIIRRHEILRTVFVTRDDQPFQIISSTEPTVLSIIDLGHADDKEQEAQQLATEDSRRPFDLAHGPLLRMTLMRLGADEHIVAFTMHHIISDGWSMGLLINEMTTLYESYSRNEPSPLPELEMQYADFASWQRAWLQGEILDSQLAYWKKKLAHAPAMLELPTDRPRNVTQSYRGATTTLTLSRSLSGALKELTKDEGATLFMTLLAAFNILLSRYTNQHDILVGTDVANRNRRETEPLLGFFINQLVLRTDLSGDPTFRELLGRVRELSLEAYAHQDLPFEKLVEAVQPERHLSRSPLFQTKLVLQNVPTGAFELSDLALSTIEIENNTSRIDLTLAIKDGDYLSGSLEYSTELFDESTVNRMLSHYTTLLESIAANPDQRILNLSFLSEAELGQLLEQATGENADYPKDKCIHELFEAQVEQTPDAIAVIFEDQQLTYAELNQRANQLANYLRELGVQEEMLVGVCARRSVEMVVGVLGILKAGAAYLPLDPSYPLERLAFMLDDAQVAVLLTQEELMDSLPSHWAQVVCLDSDADMIEAQSAEAPAVTTTAQNIAYVIYTSGSTGKPKGVMVQHAGVCNLVKAQIKTFEIEPESRVLQFASSSFDASVSEIFTAFVAGATLVIGRQESLMPGGELERLLSGQKVTTVTFPPTVLRVLNENDYEDLKVVVAAGEA
jgi:non-ribosomal peptide synthetase component F/acyl carrier protein